MCFKITAKITQMFTVYQIGGGKVLFWGILYLEQEHGISKQHPRALRCNLFAKSKKDFRCDRG